MGAGEELGLGTVVLKCLYVHKLPRKLVKEKADCDSVELE